MTRQATGIVRRIDDLGRIVIPKQVRDRLGVVPGTPLGVFVTEDAVVLERYVPGCCFCGAVDAAFTHHGHRVCASCAKAIAAMLPPAPEAPVGGRVTARKPHRKAS
jgi:transcriptional pleiotropic regulator of transition state genes